MCSTSNYNLAAISPAAGMTSAICEVRRSQRATFRRRAGTIWRCVPCNLAVRTLLTLSVFRPTQSRCYMECSSQQANSMLQFYAPILCSNCGMRVSTRVDTCCSWCVMQLFHKYASLAGALLVSCSNCLLPSACVNRCVSYMCVCVLPLLVALIRVERVGVWQSAAFLC